LYMFGRDPLDHVRRIRKQDAEDCSFFPDNATMINVADPFEPKTWTVSYGTTKKPFHECVPKTKEKIFIDIGHDELGRRQYVSLVEATRHHGTIAMHTEEQVKAEQSYRTIFARYFYKKGVYNDYTIIEELAVGNHKVILSNASILESRKALTEPELGSSVALIVNCHQTLADCPKYAITPEKIVAFPVHCLGCGGADDKEQIIEVFTNFNEAIWDALQRGNVVIHCLAGVHRAACVTVSHYLWRHYNLGHTHISVGLGEIYRSLAERRAGVAPLDYISLIKDFAAHLKQQQQNQSETP